MTIDLSKYKNNNEYGEYGSATRKLYYSEQARLEQLFFDDCALLQGYSDNPKRAQLESLAHGHSSGYSDVYNWIIELLPLII